MKYSEMNQVKYLISFVAFTLLCFYSSIVSGGSLKSEEDKTELPSTVSLVLLGRRGAGITSTVRQLLGPKVTIHAAEVAVASTDILEYTLRLNSPTGPIHLNLVDVPGLELTDNLEHDSEILSTLKSYLHDKGLPTFFLVVYRFDDKNIAQPDSQFRQLLKRVDYFQRALFHTNTDNTIFLLTRLLDEPVEVQKSPGARIDEFRNVIQQSLTFQSPVEIIVGDNKPNPDTVQMENGFIKLPNGELYPKNIWDTLMTNAEHTVPQENKELVKSVLTTMIQNRESVDLHTQEVVVHATDEDTFESDLEAFEFLLRQNNLNLPKNEIQLLLQLAYEEQDATTQISSCAQLLALQICLRNLNLESIQQLPQILSGVVKLFQQDLEGVMTSKYSLFYLKHALDLDVPEYPSQNLVVGYGYDILNDRILAKTPFLQNPTKRPSSSLGYQFPDFMECEKLTSVEEEILGNITETIDDYHVERLKYLTVLNTKEFEISISQMKGKPKSYLNLKPKDMGRLSVGKEIRILECKLAFDNDSIAIIDESFISSVNKITPFNASNVESVAEWSLFLHQYGTHVVIKSFGGGYYFGTLLFQDANAPHTRDEMITTMKNIVDFGIKGDAKSLVYQFHTNDALDLRASHLNLLDESDKNKILDDWKSSLNVQFEMLSNEMELLQLSEVVGVVNATKGHDAAITTKLLMQGKLQVASKDIIAEIDKHASKDTRMMKVKNQANALKLSNLVKTMEKHDQLNKFLDGLNE